MILIDDVATSKLHPGLDLVALVEEATRVLCLEVEVVRVGVRAETHLFHLHVLRLLPRLFLLLLLLVPILSVIDDLADGRLGGGGDLDEIQFVVLRPSQGLIDIKYSVLAIGVDETDLLGANFFVDANLVCDGSSSDCLLSVSVGKSVAIFTPRVKRRFQLFASAYYRPSRREPCICS